MDPNATLQRLIDAINDGDRRECREAANDLRNWLLTGGFMPSIERTQFYTLLGSVK